MNYGMHLRKHTSREKITRPKVQDYFKIVRRPELFVAKMALIVFDPSVGFLVLRQVLLAQEGFVATIAPD